MSSRSAEPSESQRQCSPRIVCTRNGKSSRFPLDKTGVHGRCLHMQIPLMFLLGLKCIFNLKKKVLFCAMHIWSSINICSLDVCSLLNNSCNFFLSFPVCIMSVTPAHCFTCIQYSAWLSAVPFSEKIECKESGRRS